MAIAWDATSGHSANGSGSGGTQVITVTIVAGQTGVVVASWEATGAGSSVSSVTDSGGGTWTREVHITNGATLGTDIWATGVNAAVAATTVTVTFATHAFSVTVEVGQYTGVAAFGTTNTNTGSSAAPTISLTTQDANNFVVAGLGTFTATQGGVPTAGTGNLRLANGAGTGHTLESSAGLVDNTAASPSSVTCSDNNATSQNWAAAALELRSVSGAVNAFEDDSFFPTPPAQSDPTVSVW